LCTDELKELEKEIMLMQEDYQKQLYLLKLAKEKIVNLISEKEIPYLVAFNKADKVSADEQLRLSSHYQSNSIWVSTTNKDNIIALKERIASQVATEELTHQLVGDLLSLNDLVVLVIPIDSAAPKGRLILPQQQVIRDILESGAIPVVTRESELPATLASLSRKPAMVITDSQAFEQVSKDVPNDIPLTSFSILFSRYKGNLSQVITGAKALDTLNDGETILISEGCTHHRQCDDIGTVKLPRWIKEYTKKELNFEFTSGTEFPLDLSKYKLIIHCGGCMLNEREMKYRLRWAKDSKIAISNYGIAIAQMKGILARSVELFNLND
jgi:[FeFe] hydrogenase H-cluster maturation GTPase HydF